MRGVHDFYIFLEVINITNEVKRGWDILLAENKITKEKSFKKCTYNKVLCRIELNELRVIKEEHNTTCHLLSPPESKRVKKKLAVSLKDKLDAVESKKRSE